MHGILLKLACWLWYHGLVLNLMNMQNPFLLSIPFFPPIILWERCCLLIFYSGTADLSSSGFTFLCSYCQPHLLSSLLFKIHVKRKAQVEYCSVFVWMCMGMYVNKMRSYVSPLYLPAAKAFIAQPFSDSDIRWGWENSF